MENQSEREANIELEQNLKKIRRHLAELLLSDEESRTNNYFQESTLQILEPSSEWPENNGEELENNSGKSENNCEEPENNGGEPGNNVEESENNGGKPENNDVEPESNGGKPENNGEELENNSGKSENNCEEPDNNGGEPGNNVEESENNGGKPENNDGEPESNGGKPENNDEEPDNNGEEPDNNGEEPDNNGEEPDNNVMEPDNNGGEPENNGGEPENNGGEPENNGGEPENNGGEPENNGGEALLQPIDNDDANIQKEASSANDNLEVAEPLENNFVAAISPPIASMETDEGYHTNSANQNEMTPRNVSRSMSCSDSDNATENEVVNGLLSFVENTEHFPGIDTATLIFYSDLIDQTVNRYEEYLRRQQIQQDQLPQNQQEENREVIEEDNTEQELSVAEKLEEEVVEKKHTDDEPEEILNHEQGPQTEHQDNMPVEQNRHMAWYDNFGPDRYVQFPFADVTHDNPSVISRLNDEELPRHVMLHCIINGCDFLEPFFL